MTSIHGYALLTILLLLLAVLDVKAQDSYSLYVGQQKFISTPEAPYDGAVYSSIWTPNGPIEVISQSAGGAMLRPYSYYQGTVSVSCTYYFRWLDSKGYYHNGNQTKTFYITCIPSYATLSETNLVLDAGETKRLTYTSSYTGYDSYTRSNATWTSTDMDVATVSSNGTVQGVGPGNCTIVLDPVGGPVVYCDVTVRKVDPTDISLPPTASCYIDGTVTLTPTFTPKYATSDLAWWSDNESIATVNSSGVVTGLASGSAKIWVRTVTGGYTASCTVTISEPPFTLSSTSPMDGETDVTTTAKLQATFSLDLYKGGKFGQISLTNTKDGSTVSGNISISGKTLTFAPAEELASNTAYRLRIPTGTLQNKWGTVYPSDISLTFKTAISPSDIKYIMLWNKDGSTTAIPLEEHPVFTYDTEQGVITCKTSKREVTFSLYDIVKYTLEMEEKSGTRIRTIRSDKQGNIQFSPNRLSFDDFHTNTAISVYTVNGTLVESQRTDSQGSAVLSIDSWTKGIYIVKAGSITYKIMKK